MKATELISALRELVAQHGDLDVRIHNEYAGEFEDPNEVLARRVLPGQLLGRQGEVFFGIDYTVVGDRAAQLRHDAPTAPKAGVRHFR